MHPPLNVLEPTLEDAHGHCRSLLSAFCTAAAGYPIRIWASARAGADLLPIPGVTIVPRFHRRVRVPQQFLLARRLLRDGARVWIPTAGRTDILAIDRALGDADPRQAVLYVHWLKPTPSRMRSLGAVARRRPDLQLLATTPGVRSVLLDAGFTNVTVVPYPLTSRLRSRPGPAAFQRLLYAGAARRDKGFHRVVDLLARLAESANPVPVTLQTGGDYYGRVSREIEDDRRRLEALGYSSLETLESGLDPDAYERLFHGAVCLQLYSPVDFADRVSGVTLDALAAGAPVLTLEGTWIARQVERFGAGVAVHPDRPETWPDAVSRLISAYPDFTAAASEAGRVLSEEHAPRHLVDAVLGD